MNSHPKLQPKEHWLVYPESRAGMALHFTNNASSGNSTYLNAVVHKFFADGSPDFFIPNLHKFTGAHVIYLADWSTSKAVHFDLLALWPIAELGPASLTIVVPFMATATMEREVVPGSVASANVDAKMLSVLPCRKRIVTIDLHTMQQQFYFYNCAVTMASMMRACVPDIVSDGNDWVICFPDDGAVKRFKSFFPKNELAVCAKVRDGDARKVTLNEGNVTGKRVLIVDDLVRSGGTLVECAKVLRAAGATVVSVFVTHACFQHQNWTHFLKEGKWGALIDRFYTTDTVEKHTALIECNDDKFTVFSTGKYLDELLFPDCNE